MNKIKALGSIGLLTGAALALAACGNKNNANNQDASKEKFPQTVPNKPKKNGGTLKYAILANTPFKGIFEDTLSTDSIDDTVGQFGHESLVTSNGSYEITNKGAATFKLDNKAKTITFKLKKGVKWSDGKPVTAKDMEYPYEIIANSKSGSQRYSSLLENIVGFKEFHEGKAKTIKGLEMPNGENGNTLVIHFKEMYPGMNMIGSGYFWKSATPYHYLKDVPMNKLISSDKVRQKPLFFGPYKIDKIVRGQSVTWSPNKYYYKGQPHIKKITETVISSNSAAQALKSHKFDIIDVVNSQWQQVKNTKGYNFIANTPLSYNYLGFKVGKWDKKAGKNVMNKNAKMNNKALRQAIAYGMNVDQVNKRYTQGLTFRIPTLVPKAFGEFFDKDIKGYTYNIKKGNELLDKAGYKKKGTYRVQPNGKPLTIHLAAMTGSSTQEPIIQNYIQQWKKMGLNVKLTGGRLIEGNSFYDKVQNDDPGIDMFMAGWSLAGDPSQNNLYGERAPFNFSRFVTKENNKLLAEMDGKKALNTEYRKNALWKWQKYMFDEAYVVPVSNAYKITAVNSKLTGYSVSNDSDLGWNDVAFTK
ncbi:MULTISPECIES: oligopeptide ABC transporter substrate-binding protein [Lactobacillus]|uniref:Oligopeptide ABC transporter substrate-binding protein n=1 Tax=Lactobacillus xujianguonis TaxID=2495899 RepID=A0A437SXH9_9LACO|nr:MULTISPECIES: oligopeptide ABC transporter substrate-binding protein [Lactobacillus]RVU71633.1 oligopeptide ABC transporter substrate-binding protein [Lactobacillus xujianguonis]RVU77716.1 oligopeptide ABC transporter substrate-binding protein [Lactobacillus xujianguonis]